MIRFMAAFYESEEAAVMLGALLGDVAYHDAFFGTEEDLGLSDIGLGMAAATHRELEARYGALDRRERRTRVVGKLLDFGSRFGQSGELARSIEYSDEVIQCFGSSAESGGALNGRQGVREPRYSGRAIELFRRGDRGILGRCS
ncbi:hypothetical protein [Candidatus Palauibacter sp.]|uniref:hypothetical protein n=1 Tax=Candidatus Palauibacter sp. TaxID=3101350 RepID=UPI003B01EF17